MNASLSTIVPSDFGFPKLVVQKISGLSETSTTIDGVIKKLLVAVKNTNFIIYLGVEMSPNSFLTSDDPNYMALNFSAISLEIRLVYDSPDEKVGRTLSLLDLSIVSFTAYHHSITKSLHCTVGS